MTQIISCITHDYVVQVSDRRLVYIGVDGSIKTGDDNANKAIFFCNRASICYAGLAELEGKRTDYWLVNAIKDQVSLSGACNSIAEKAMIALRKVKLASNLTSAKLQTFVASGWTSNSETPLTIDPIIAVVSNYNPSQNRNDPPLPEDEFSLKFKILSKKEKYFLNVAGQALNHNQMVELDRLIRICVRKNTGPSSVALMIVNAMRQCSKLNAMVGRNLMVNSIPRTTVTNDNQEWRITSSIPNKNSSTFLYHTGNNTVVKYGPHFVCNGSAVVDFESGSLN